MAKTKEPRNVRLEAENYRTTILALHSFAEFLKKGRPAARHAIGRRMTTSKNNAISKETDQTPDLVVQASPNEGYVCEVKATMSSEKGWWDSHVKQLQKYDDDLRGWWTDSEGLANDSNTVLLVSSVKSIRFKKHIEEAIASGSVSFKKPVAFVGFIQTGTPEESILFQLDWGNIYNAELHEALDNRKLIPLERSVASVGPLKFYDSPPPVEYLMEVLWTHLFNDLKTAVKVDDKSNTWPIEINIPDTTSDLQRLYGHIPKTPREVSFPQIKWVREALEHFEVLRLATKKDLDNYTINYRNIRGDLLEKFSKARKKIKEKADKKRQMELPLTASKKMTPVIDDEAYSPKLSDEKTTIQEGSA